MDKYAIISIFILIVLCVWHAIIGAIVFIEVQTSSITTDNLYVWIDRYVFLIFSILYGLLHLLMVVWYYKVPCRTRREMEQRDQHYRNQLKLQRHSNGYLGRLSSRHKFALLNVTIEEEVRMETAE